MILKVSFKSNKFCENYALLYVSDSNYYPLFQQYKLFQSSVAIEP